MKEKEEKRTKFSEKKDNENQEKNCVEMTYSQNYKGNENFKDKKDANQKTMRDYLIKPTIVESNFKGGDTHATTIPDIYKVDETKTPNLTDSENSNYSSEEDSEEEEEKSKKKKKQKRKENKEKKMSNDEITKRYEEMVEKIEKLTQVTKEEKEELKYETMLKTLKTSMPITKEQLDVTLSAKSQAEQHIMVIERENLDLRSICKKHNIDIKEELGEAETLYERETMGQEREAMKRMLNVLLLSQGFNKSEVEQLSMYAKDGDQDKLEKATKGMILRQNQHTTENKDKSANAEITID